MKLTHRLTIFAVAVATVFAFVPASLASHGNGAIDLGITQTDNPDPVEVNTFVTYTISITSNVAHPVNELKIDEMISAGEIVSASGSKWECSILAQSASCSQHGATNDNKDSGAITVVVLAPDSPGRITSTATLSGRGNEPDPDPTNNVSVEHTQVGPGTDITVSQFAEPHPVVTAGHHLHYVITASNNGDNLATGVVVDHEISAGSVQNASGEGWSCTFGGTTSSCDLNGPLAAGANSTVDIVALMPSSAGTVTAEATVSSASGDTDPSNNTDQEETTVQALGGNDAFAYIPPGGGFVTTNPLGTPVPPRPEAAPESASASAFADQVPPADTSGATPANPTFGDAQFPVGPGGLASLHEDPNQLAICALADCAGAAVDVIVPPGYNDPTNPIVVHLVYDETLAPPGEDPRTVFVEKPDPVTGQKVTTVVPPCEIAFIAAPSPCVAYQWRFDGDLVIRILMLSQDPKYQG